MEGVTEIISVSEVITEVPLAALIGYIVYRLKGIEDSLKTMAFNQKVVLRHLLNGAQINLKGEENENGN